MAFNVELLERDYIEDALSLLLPQFDDSVNIRGFLSSLLNPTISWQDCVKQLYGAYDVRYSLGVQLDMLGKLLNVPRDGKVDEAYRKSIIARIAINNSDGTGRSVIELLSLILGQDIRFDLIEQYPAAVTVIIYDQQDIMTTQLVSDLVPIGVDGTFLTNPYQGKVIWFPSEVDYEGNTAPSPAGVLPEVDDIDSSNIVIAEIDYILP